MLAKMKTLSSLLFVLLLFSGCGGTKKMKSTTFDSNWKHCSSIDTSSNIIFSDNFDNNKNGWPITDNNQFLVKVENGVLNIKKYNTKADNGGCLWLVKAIRGFNARNNFQISFDAHFIKAKDSYNAIDVQWGNIQTDSYQFSFTDDGQIMLRRYTENKSPRWIPIASTVMNNLVNKQESNRIVIRQIDGNCIVCINDIEVMHTRIESIPGNCIGIEECWKVAWQMDNLEIRQ